MNNGKRRMDTQVILRAGVIAVIIVIIAVVFALLVNAFSPVSAEAANEETASTEVAVMPQEVVDVNYGDERNAGLLKRDVAVIQRKLDNLGYSLEVDGKYGAKTDAAVRCFQMDNDLYADGICGKNTQNALGITELLAEPGTDYLYGPLAGSGTEYRVITNLAAARTMVYHWNGSDWDVLVDTSCIVGAPGSETVKGRFQIIAKDEVGFVKNNHKFTNTMTFYAPDGDYTKAYCYHSYTKDMNGNVLDSGNEHFLSLGCVRIPEEALLTMFEAVPTETDVYIY